MNDIDSSSTTVEQMADVIKSDIEKIERALNIRVDDVEIEVALNAAFPQAISTLFHEKRIENIPFSYHFVENLNPHHIDRSSLLAFATALNLCYQRNLFQLHKHCQSIVTDTSNKSGQSTNEILPIQIFESYTGNLSSHFPINSDSIQNLRRMMQREEKARLSSNETIEKLIESVARNIRENREHQLTRRIEILQTSTRDQNDELELAKKKLDHLRTLSSRELIREENETNSIDWKNIAEISMGNQYSEKCCRHAWRQLCLPVINDQQDWSPEEDQLLEKLVQMHGAYADQWTSISLQFSHRSPYMCASRYMFLENHRSDKIKFSSDQINQLKAVIEEHRHGNYIPLNKVAYKFGCSLSTIRREWRNIDPNVRRGQWQVDEDEALLRSVLKQSNRGTINWNLVASEVSGRSLTKCYHRYVHLTRQQVKTEFEPIDDQLLIEQHQLKNARWSQIQASFPGRSCYTLQNRYRKLMQYRQINELFHSQHSDVQSFILKHFPTKTPVISSATYPYQPPNFQLTSDQLQILTSNSLFLQFCHEIDPNAMTTPIGIRQFLNKLSPCNDIQQITQIFFSTKRTRRN